MNKLFKNILYLSSLTLALASCQEEKVEPGEPELDGCYGVYFPEQKATTDLNLDPADPLNATITVKRKNAEGAITVPVTVSDTSGLFTYTPVTFEDGNDETTFSLKFDGIGIGNTYLVSFTIDDPLYASKYNDNPVSLDFKVVREKWNNLGWGTYEEQGYWEFDEPVKVPIYQNDLNHNLYRVYMKFDDGSGEQEFIYTKDSDEYFSLKVLKAGDEHKGVKVETDGLVVFDVFDTGFYNKNYPSAPIWFVHPSGFSSLASEDKWQCNKVLAYQDDEDKTPAGIQLAPYYYINGVGGWNYTQEDGIITIVFPGAELTDYTVSVSVGESEEGKSAAAFTLGKDVAKTRYAVYEGELSKAAGERHVNAIANGTEESEVLPESGTVSLSFDKSGTYTLVAVTFDSEDNMQSSVCQPFNYVAAGDEDAYAVELTAGLELTSRYAPEGYTKLNSAQFFIYGKDITGLKMNVYPSAKFDMSAVEEDLAEMESVSDSLLNLVNTTGWSDLATGLSPLTDYTLVVWATNGYSSRTVTASVTTDGLAKVKKGTGAYTYTVLFVNDDETPVTDEGLELYADPNYENTYVIPEWGYGVDFKFTYDPGTGKVKVPVQATGATYGAYGPVYVGEAKDVYSEKYEKYDQLVDSKYDAASGTFSFCVVYFVNGGIFGWDVETFKLDQQVAFTASAGKPSPYSVKLGNVTRTLTRTEAVRRSGLPGQVRLAGISAEIRR